MTPEYPPEQWGGLARTVSKVSRHVSAMGAELHVAHFVVSDDPPPLLDENRTTRRSDGIAVHRISVGREKFPVGRRTLWDCPHTLTFQMMYQSLEILHREQGFDLFHSFFLYPMGYVTGLLARRFGRPSIVTLVGNDIKKYMFSPEKVEVCRSGLDNAGRVVALSRELAEMAHALTPVLHKSAVIYNSVDVPAVVWQPGSNPGDRFRVGCAGIFKYAKGLPYLMKAVAGTARSYRITLDLRGQLRESEKEIFETMIRRLGMRELLHFAPALPHNEVCEWLRTLDVFALPSVSEGCPNILMEAMAAGLPCIATRVGAVEDLIEDGVSGLLVPWGNSAALADALERLIRDPGLAANLGAAARTKMLEFSSLREFREWRGVYRELVGL